jgi:hypothetical protein
VKGVRVTPDGRIADRVDVSISENDQLLADLAFDGERYLVAWGDRRSLGEQIYSTRVTTDGRVLDPDGRRLEYQDTTWMQTEPTVAAGDSGFFLVWNSSRSIGTVIQGGRIGADGRPLDSLPIDFTSDTLFDWHPAIASNGCDYLVVWCGEQPNGIGQDLYGTRVSGAGILLDTVPILICRTAEGLIQPAVTFLRDRYLVVWTDQREWFDIYAARVRQDGTVLDPNGFPVAADTPDNRDPAVATDGHRFMVVWSRLAGDDYDLYAAMIDTAGAVGIAAPAPARVSRLRAAPVPSRGPVAFTFAPAHTPGMLFIHDVAGRLRARLPVPAGQTRVRWRPQRKASDRPPVGVYTAILERGSERGTCRFVLH